MKLIEVLEKAIGYFSFLQIFEKAGPYTKSVVACKYYPQQLLVPAYDIYHPEIPRGFVYLIPHARITDGKLLCIFANSIKLVEVDVNSMFMYIENKKEGRYNER